MLYRRAPLKSALKFQPFSRCKGYGDAAKTPSLRPVLCCPSLRVLSRRPEQIFFKPSFLTPAPWSGRMFHPELREAQDAKALAQQLHAIRRTALTSRQQEGSAFSDAARRGHRHNNDVLEAEATNAQQTATPISTSTHTGSAKQPPVRLFQGVRALVSHRQTALWKCQLP